MNTETVLLIPPVYKQNIPTGYTLKKLYMADVNRRYCKAQTIYMIEALEDENDSPSKFVSESLHHNSSPLKMVDNFITSYNFVPNYEESLPVQLHRINKTTIYEVAKQLFEEPAFIDDEWYHSGGHNLREEGTHYNNNNYTNYSMRGGVWHPEDLFMESESNRQHAYWKPLEVRFDPSQRGPGNKFTTSFNKWENSQMCKCGGTCNVCRDTKFRENIYSRKNFENIEDSYIGAPSSRRNDYYLAPIGTLQPDRQTKYHKDVNAIMRDRIGDEFNSNVFNYIKQDDGPNDPPKLIVGNYNMWENLTKRHLAEIENNTEDRRIEMPRRLGY